MSKQPIIYKAASPAPYLPQLGLFDYLFPRAPGISPAPQFDPSLPAFIDGLDGSVLTRGELEDGALRLATGIRSLGVRRGDTVCLWGLNTLPWARAAFGLMATGVTITPANAAYQPQEIAHQINDSGASAIFVVPALLPGYEQSRAHQKRPLPNSRVVLLCSTADKPAGSPYKSYEELYGERGHVEHFEGTDAHTTAWLCYSSGTTGLPKGVMTTHYNLTSMMESYNTVGLKHVLGRDTILGILPMSHIFGLLCLLLQPLTRGVPVVVMPRFEEVSVLKAIEKYRITFATFVPPIILVLLHSKERAKYDVSSLQRVMCGAAPLSEDLARAFTAAFPGCVLYQGYGMTEASPGTHWMNEDEALGQEGWVGQLLPGTEARLVTEDGTDAPFGERGELWCRGPNIMKGYHNNPKATEGTMSPGGWYKTGDVLICDERGWFKVVDRVKELIKYKGFQVAPAELEALLLTHPKLIDAGVIGIYDKSQETELPRGYIVPASEVAAALKTDADKARFAKEIQAWIAARVAPHKRLSGGVVILPAIPKSPSGKILRKDLRVLAEKELAPGAVAKL